jgi:enoyl-CoA hydratase
MGGVGTGVAQAIRLNVAPYPVLKRVGKGARMSDYDRIQYEVDEHIARIWLNRPEKKNAFTRKMIGQMRAAIETAENDHEVRVIVFRGRGNTFSAGVDLAEALQGDDLSADHAPWLDVCTRIAKSKKPTVAVVEGYLVGGAHALMTNCDFAIASADARIGDFFIKRGLIGAANAYYWLPRMVGIRRARELVMTGKLLSGTEAAEWGLVNMAAPAEELDGVVDKFVSDLADKSGFTLKIAKMVLDRSLDLDFDSFSTMQELSSYFIVERSHDAREGIAAFVEKRSPEWKDC